MAYLAKVDEPDDAIWKRTMILADAERKLNEVPNVPILTRAQAMAEAERQMADQQRQNRWNLVHLAAVDCHNSRPMKMHPSAITHGPGEGGMSHLFGSSLPEIRIPAVVLATDVDSDDDDGPPPGVQERSRGGEAGHSSTDDKDIGVPMNGLGGWCHVWDYSRRVPLRKHRSAKEIASGRICES